MWFKSGTTILISSLSACAPCFSLQQEQCLEQWEMWSPCPSTRSCRPILGGDDWWQEFGEDCGLLVTTDVNLSESSNSMVMPCTSIRRSTEEKGHDFGCCTGKEIF